MNDSHKYAAKILSNGSHALAGYAAARLIDEVPEAADVFSGDAAGRWQACLAARLDDLGAALSAGRATIFASQLAWAKAIYSSRGIPPALFGASVHCLRDVVVEELPEKVSELAVEYIDEALRTYDAEYDERPLAADAPPDRLAASYLLAIFEGDRRRASQMILAASESEFDIPTLFEQVLVPAQKEIGRMWMAGEITIGEEHFASDTTKRVIAQLADRADYREPNGKVVLTAATAGNQHDIGIHLVASLFEMDGWRVIQLGADVPIADLAQSVTDFDADLVVLSAALAIHIPTLETTIQSIRSWQRDKDVKVIVGGLVFASVPDLAEQLGADGYADTPLNGTKLARRLFEMPE